MTRQPNADDLADGISFEAARRQEKTFFETTTPWKSLTLDLQARLGTRNLSVSLSEQLLSFIREK